MKNNCEYTNTEFKYQITCLAKKEIKLHILRKNFQLYIEA